MITFDEALQIAKTLKPNLDGCTEYENGFVFSSSKDAGFVGGRGHTSCVIRKRDGKAIPMPAFVMEGTGKEIRDFEIKLDQL